MAANTNPSHSNANEVITWAQRFNISSYQKLLDAGFDVMYVLPTITEKDLDDIGINLPGEKRKILYAITQLPLMNSTSTSQTSLSPTSPSSITPQMVYTTYTHPPSSPSSGVFEEKKKRAPPHCLVCHATSPKRSHKCPGECHSFESCGYERGHKELKLQKEDVENNKDEKEAPKESIERRAIRDRILYVEPLPECDKWTAQRTQDILKERDDELKQFVTPEQRQQEAQRIAYMEWQDKRVRWVASKDAKKNLMRDKAKLDEMIDAELKQISPENHEGGSAASNALQTLSLLQNPIIPSSPSPIPIQPPGPTTTTIITHSTNGDVAEDWNWIQAGGAKELKKEAGRKQTWFCKSKKETGCDARKTVITRPTGTVEIWLTNPHNHPKPPVKKKAYTTLVRTETTTQSIQHVQSSQPNLHELNTPPSLHSAPLLLPTNSGNV
eukprot:TRINITY_DN885_c0_g2_i1.p1 TRINITY_DN885_c0_g2~~TRINITY_DN885_c0_g2_i1.p1  ORF type:complete len:490 (+),score=119.24 TRINITY_DN885_c0_g2_i1:153-1472(+)